MTNRAILVTGASKGIGAAIARRLGSDGFDVVAHFHNDADGAAAVANDVLSEGRVARTIRFDISDREACREILERDMVDHEAYYGVVLNAGIALDNAFPAMDGDEWDGVINTNLGGFYNVLHPVIMPMIRARRPGRIVTLSSISGIVGNRGQANYAAAKAGIIGATKSLALELAKRRITVNCVAPGIVDTQMTDGIGPAVIDQLVPMRRAGQPEEVAALVSFLCSDDAGYITRQVISVNGGML